MNTTYRIVVTILGIVAAGIALNSALAQTRNHKIVTREIHVSDDHATDKIESTAGKAKKSMLYEPNKEAKAMKFLAKANKLAKVKKADFKIIRNAEQRINARKKVKLSYRTAAPLQS